MGMPRQEGLGPNFDVVFQHHVGPNPSLVRVDNGHAVEHVSMVNAQLQNLGCFSQLNAGVNAQAFVHVFSLNANGSTAAFARNLNNVGKVEFALRIVAVDLCERFEKHGSVEAIEARIAFGDSCLHFVAVLLFNNAFHHAARVAHNAAITLRVGGFHREHCNAGVARFARLHQFGQGLRRNEGAVAVQH